MNQTYNSPDMSPEKGDPSSFNVRAAIKKLKRKQMAQIVIFLLAGIFIVGSMTSAKVKTLKSVKKGSIKNAYLGKNSVTSDKIKNGEVSNADLDNNSVTSGKIADGEVSNADIANSSITTDKIADGNVNTNDLANNSVTSGKIADGEIFNSDLAAGAVNSSKITDGSIAAEDIRDGTITAAKMASGVLTGSGSSAWGSITGTLSSQTDLQDVLNDKANKNEITIGDDGYGSTLADAITAISSTPATLVVPSGTQEEGGGVTIPANVTLRVLRGALIHEADGTTLTINGSLEAGLYQVFSWSGSGSVALEADVVKVPEWWGADGDDATDDNAALQAWAATGGNLYLPKKIYKITAGIIVPQHAVIDGLGTIHQTVDTKEGLIVYDDVTVKNIGLKGCGTVPATPGNPGGYHHLGLTAYSIHMDTSDGASAMSTYVGKRIVVDNVMFTGGWERCIVLTSDNVVKNSTFTNNMAEAVLFHGVNNKAVFNTIDGIGGWAIDFNGGDAEASFNIIKNVAQDSSYSGDAGGICFAGLSVEKPMTNLRAIGNTIDNVGLGYGIFILSKPIEGEWGDIVVSDNTLNGGVAGTAETAILVYPGSEGGTNPAVAPNVHVANNIANKFKIFISGYQINGGSIRGNTGKTFAPGANLAAIMLGADAGVIVDGNVIKDVNGAGDTVMRIEGANDNNKIINNIGEGANVGFFNADAAGTKNDISDNDFSECTYPIYLNAVPLAAGNRLERNIGYVPYNGLAPNVPTTGTEVANNLGYSVVVTISGGTVTAVNIGSVSGHLTTLNVTGLPSSQVFLPAGWIISLTHSSAPTWVWEGIQ
jgi:hypothetical protein